MIRLVGEIPKLDLPRAEIVKINNNYILYKEIALFWLQDDTRAVMSMLDGNLVIYNINADIPELREFINVISPSSVFSDAETLKALFKDNFEPACVMQSQNNFKSGIESDRLKSDEIYELLDVSALELPKYEFFAVDFCLRLNRGYLKYFAKKSLCAAVAITDTHTVLLNGIASHKKGMGTTALCGVLSSFSEKEAIAVCKKEICGFYEKNKFTHMYDVGYWRKRT